MEVIKSKIKLFNRKTGTVEVFLSGLPLNASQWLETILTKFADTESDYSVIREQYVGLTVDTPKKTK